MIYLLIGWVVLIFIASSCVINKSGNALIIKPFLWYLTLLFIILIGGLSLFEYLIIGESGISNRWTLAVLSKENIYLFSLLWFISAISFTFGSILTHIPSIKQNHIRKKYPIYKCHNINISLHVAFVLSVLSALLERHFTLLKGIDRTAAMWMEYEYAVLKINLPYKAIFFVYITLFFMWRDKQQKRKKNFGKYLHMFFITTFIIFSVLRGGRLVVIEVLLIWMIFKLWKDKGIRLKTMMVYSVSAVIISLAFYNFRSVLLGMITGMPPNNINLGRISLLQGDAGGHMYVTIKSFMEGQTVEVDSMLFGSPLVNAIVGLIPSSINPISLPTINYLFNQAFGIMEGGFFMNIVSDGIFNFGRQFFYIQAFLLGGLVGILDRLRFYSFGFKSILYISCASVVIYGVISDLRAFLQVILWRGIFSFIVIIITRFIEGNLRKSF